MIDGPASLPVLHKIAQGVRDADVITLVTAQGKVLASKMPSKWLPVLMIVAKHEATECAACSDTAYRGAVVPLGSFDLTLVASASLPAKAASP